MIDITIKKIREKLDSGDKFRDLVDARFDKIIDQISGLRDKLIKEWTGGIQMDSLSEVQKIFLAFSEGKNQDYVFSTKLLATLSKQIKQKPKIQT